MKRPESATDPGARRLVLLAGGQARGEAWVAGQLAAVDQDAILWIADTAPTGIQATPVGRVSRCLGAESRLLVFNAHQGFHPDAFAAAAGTLRGGGDCVVLVPPLESWPAYADPDKARFACYPRDPGRHARSVSSNVCCACGGIIPAVRIVDPGSAPALRVAGPAPPGFRLTAEQQAAVASIERVAHGHARRPLVLTADRGRGKSTVLGVAAAGLLAGGLARVTVVAPQRAAVSTLFGMPWRRPAGVATVSPTPSIGDGELRFRLPSECMTQTTEGLGLVLVDEAAAIPVAVLSRLLEHSNRLVFASTVHGYEGSGRGFELRFRSLLQQAMPQWRGLRLSAPVRWRRGRPAGGPAGRLVSARCGACRYRADRVAAD